VDHLVWLSSLPQSQLLAFPLHLDSQSHRSFPGASWRHSAVDSSVRFLANRSAGSLRESTRRTTSPCRIWRFVGPTSTEFCRGSIWCGVRPSIFSLQIRALYKNLIKTACIWNRAEVPGLPRLGIRPIRTSACLPTLGIRALKWSLNSHWPSRWSTSSWAFYWGWFWSGQVEVVLLCHRAQTSLLCGAISNSTLRMECTIHTTATFAVKTAPQVVPLIKTSMSSV